MTRKNVLEGAVLGVLAVGAWWWMANRSPEPQARQPESGDGPQVVLFHTECGDTGMVSLARYMEIQNQLEIDDSVQILSPHLEVLFDATLGDLERAVFDTVIVGVTL